MPIDRPSLHRFGANFVLRLGLAAAGTIFASGASAQGDECTDATNITFDTLTAFDTTSATESALDFTCFAGNGTLRSQDVWFKFTATADYMAQATTCNTSTYDTKIEVYEGTCGALVTVGCNDDTAGCLHFASVVDWPAVKGTEYFIRIGGFRGVDFGPGQILVTGPPPALANDECVGAIALGSGVPEAWDNTLATFSAGAPAPSCGSGVSDPLDIWYTFQILLDGPVDVETCLSTFDTRLQVYSGGCGSLVNEACNDDNGPHCTGSRASVSFAGTAGTTYYARVAGFSGGFGIGEIVATYPDAVGNDDCSGAIAIGAGQTGYSNTGATDSGEDLPCSLNGELSDVWFSYTASADCPVTFDLSGSDYDTAIHLFSGDCMTLTSIGCDDDGGTGLDSFLTFDAVGGNTYLLQVGGFQGLTGNGIINLTEGLGSIVCLGELNSTGAAGTLKVSGSDVATDNAMTLNVSNLPLNVNLMFVNSQEVNFVANPAGSEGNLCIASFAMGRHADAIMNSGAAGSGSLTVNLANLPTNLGFTAAISGQTWYWQGWYRDTVAAAATSNFTGAVCVTFN